MKVMAQVTHQDLKNLRTELVTRMDDGFESVLTEMRNMANMISDKFVAVDKRFEAIDKRFENIDKRFEDIDKRFETIDKRFEDIDKRFARIDKRFKDIDKRFEQMDKRFDNLERRLAVCQTDIHRILIHLDSIEKRLDLSAEERVMLGHQIERAYKWLKQLADKVGVELKP